MWFINGVWWSQTTNLTFLLQHREPGLDQGFQVPSPPPVCRPGLQVWTPKNRNTNMTSIFQLYSENTIVQVKLHTVQAHLSEPANLLIQKTFVLFPLSTRTRTETRSDQDRLTAGMWQWKKYWGKTSGLVWGKKSLGTSETSFWSQLKLEQFTGACWTMTPPRIDMGGGVKEQANRERHVFV